MSTPWMLRPDAVRLHAWSCAALEAIRTAFESTCRAWAADWAMTECTVSVGPVSDEDAASAWVAHGTAEARVWLRAEKGGRHEAEAALLGRAATPIGDEVLRACRNDLRDRLLGSFGMTRREMGAEEVLPARLARPWSGALSLVCGQVAHVVAEVQPLSRLVQRTASSRPPADERDGICTVARALSDYAVQLDLELAGCELPAQALLDLQAGDVVCLPHALDRALRVRDASGNDCFAGDLRSRAGTKVVQLRATEVAGANGSREEGVHAERG